MRNLWLGWLCLGAAVLLAQPVIDNDGVTNNASYLSSALPNSGIAQGSIFAVFGRGLGPATLQQATSFPLPTILGETEIRVTVSGTTVNAIILYTVAGQVGAILPSNTPVGTGALVVVYRGETSAAVPIRVVRNTFGIFTINQAGSGPAVVTDSNFRVNLITDSFRAADVAILWGTGLGPVSGNEAGGPLPGDIPVDLEVLVGGRRAEVLGKSRSGCCAGLDQIAFRIPAEVEGCYVPLVVRAGGVLSNYASISVSRSRVCSDPHGFSASDLERLQAGGTFSLGNVSLLRTNLKFTVPALSAMEDLLRPGQLPPPGSTIEMKTDAAGASFLRYDFGRLIRSRGVSGNAPFGQCMVYVYRGTDTADPIRADNLNAGPVLSLNGPKGAKQLTRQASGIYSAQLGGGGLGVPGGQPEYLDPGSYTVDNGAGGPDVGPFRATLQLPTLVTWTNQDAINNIPRSQGLRITWTGGDPNREFVQIYGSSGRTTPSVGGLFICTERASVLQFTVPPEVLSVLPPSEQVQGSPNGVLMVGSTPLFEPNKFTARGLDAAYFTYRVLSLKQVNYQ